MASDQSELDILGNGFHELSNLAFYTYYFLLFLINFQLFSLLFNYYHNSQITTRKGFYLIKVRKLESQSMREGKVNYRDSTELRILKL